MKVNFYNLVHKAIRREFFRISVQFGKTDWNDSQGIRHIFEDFKQFSNLLQAQSKMEHSFFFPLIQQHLPQSAIKLEQDHSILEEMIQEVLAECSVLENNSPHTAQSWDSIYLNLNRCLSAYLIHLDQKEKNMVLLTEQCTQQELSFCLNSIFNNFSHSFLVKSTRYFLPALCLAEQIQLLNQFKFVLNASQYDQALLIAQSHLTAKEWDLLVQGLSTLSPGLRSQEGFRQNLGVQTTLFQLEHE